MGKAVPGWGDETRFYGVLRGGPPAVAMSELGPG